MPAREEPPHGAFSWLSVLAVDEYLEANRRNWDERARAHAKGTFYDVEGFLAGKRFRKDVDRDALRDLRGKSLLHLQCHLGLETLDWARDGATVTGLDFSGEALTEARRVRDALGLRARFVESDVYEAVDALAGERFDAIFTGIGALCWLPQLAPWAEVVHALLKPGGTFYLRESHPFLWSLDDARDDGMLVARYHWLEQPVPDEEDGTSTYGADEVIDSARHYVWNHGFGDLFGALMGAGLKVTRFEELDFVDYPALDGFVQGEDGFWRHPTRRYPWMYALWATR